MITASDVARYLIWGGEQRRKPLSNMEALKLLYYAQGWFLAIYDQALFGQHLEAWPAGPVQRAVYGQYKNNGFDPILGVQAPELTQPIINHLDCVLSVFGDAGGHRLQAMTHSEDPWLNARNGLPPDAPSSNVISVSDMKKFFTELIQGRSVDPKFDWARDALIERAKEEDSRFQEAMTWVDENYGEALQRLAK